ncbi:MAG: metal-sulfur cluster assembly factor [bacterium]
MVTKEMVMNKLSLIVDPELDIDIISLGLIYDVALTDEKIIVTMTLTTPGCPLAPIIDQMIRETLVSYEMIVELKLVWDPPWTSDMMSEEARLQLGMI